MSRDIAVEEVCTMDGGSWEEMFKVTCGGDGDIELVRHRVENGVDVNDAHPEFLSTPLVASALAGQAQTALFLLAFGALPDLWFEFDGLPPFRAALRARLPALVAARALSEPRHRWR